MARAFPTAGEIAVCGPVRTIVYLRLASGDQPAADFLLGLTRRDQARFWALLRRMAEGKIRRNREQFSRVEGGIFAFKTKAWRLLCFHDRGQMILLAGGARINRKLPHSAIERAMQLQEEYRRGKVAVLDDKRVAG
ncbi:MAG TPA: type II toxin-antitoxin system RelE/ParE family toxin [Candidatus Binatia bacterium]|nr:type II toxin-antitoxin system RelE/ParE family toxin [Candidatus Binatia bacterium]